MSGWGRDTWGSIVWGEDFEDVSITSTTNLLTLTLRSVSSVTGDTNLTLSTNLLNVTAGTTLITANANLTLSTNVLNTTVGTISHQTSIDVSLTAPGDLPWGATSWGSGSWGNIGGMLISQGAEEEAVPSVEVSLSTNLLTFTLTSVSSITADANVTASTNLLTISLGTEDAVPNSIVTLSTNLLNISMGTASGESLSIINPTGVNITASTGRLFISAWAVVDIGVTNTWSVVDIAA